METEVTMVIKIMLDMFTMVISISMTTTTLMVPEVRIEPTEPESILQMQAIAAVRGILEIIFTMTTVTIMMVAMATGMMRITANR